MKMHFITRHAPTKGQISLAEKAGYKIGSIGDIDAFDEGAVYDGLLSLAGEQKPDYHGQVFTDDAVMCVHPLTALRAHSLGYKVAVFENKNRAAEGEPPQFEAASLVIIPPIRFND